MLCFALRRRLASRDVETDGRPGPWSGVQWSRSSPKLASLAGAVHASPPRGPSLCAVAGRPGPGETPVRPAACLPVPECRCVATDESADRQSGHATLDLLVVAFCFRLSVCAQPMYRVAAAVADDEVGSRTVRRVSPFQPVSSNLLPPAIALHFLGRSVLPWLFFF